VADYQFVFSKPTVIHWRIAQREQSTPYPTSPTPTHRQSRNDRLGPIGIFLKKTNSDGAGHTSQGR